METTNPTTTASLADKLSEAFETSVRHTNDSSRVEAMSAFKKLGFPAPRNEEYRFTPITRIVEKSFSAEDFSREVPSGIASPDEFLIPELRGSRIVFVNGRFHPDFSSILPEHQQLTILPLEEALRNNALAQSHFAKTVPSSQDAFAALNAALWQGGVFIHAPENIHTGLPITILHLHDASHHVVTSQTRVLVLLEKNSQLNLIEKWDTRGNLPVFSSCVEEIVVGEHASLEYHVLQNDPGNVFQNRITTVHQSGASKVKTLTVTMDGQLIRNNLTILVDGEQCESHFYGLYLLDKNTLADNHTVVDHRQPNSYSNELYKGIMDGNSKGVFNGKIYVRPHAQKTNAFQSNRNILMSDTATVNTKPQLEIWADDVKCSHGCTSGQLDEEALFYLQSRGISYHTARAMVLNAFADEVLQFVTDPVLKNYLNALVSERLQSERLQKTGN